MPRQQAFQVWGTSQLVEKLAEELEDFGSEFVRREAMMAGDLRALAEKYVALSAEIEDLRCAMLTALTNCAGDAPRPIRPAWQSSGGPHPKAIATTQAEDQILGLLKQQPGMRTTELVKATGAKGPTVTERLRRMKQRGAVQRDAANGG